MFRKIADPFSGFAAESGSPEKEKAAGIKMSEIQKTADGGRLAGAVGADKAGDAAFFHRKARLFQGKNGLGNEPAPVSLRQFIDG